MNEPARQNFSSCHTYEVKIFIAGPIEQAKQILRQHCFENPFCVTIEPTHFIYNGGEETGYVVGLRNYPRFSLPKEDCFGAFHKEAKAIAEKLMTGTYQRTCMVVGPNETFWYKNRDFIEPPAGK